MKNAMFSIICEFLHYTHDQLMSNHTINLSQTLTEISGNFTFSYLLNSKNFVQYFKYPIAMYLDGLSVDHGNL